MLMDKSKTQKETEDSPKEKHDIAIEKSKTKDIKELKTLAEIMKGCLSCVSSH